jgi:PAS domain-containing protein
VGVALYRPADEIMGRQVRDVLPPDVAAEAMRQIEAVLETGRLDVNEYSLEIDGEIRYFESRMVAAREADETMTIIRDITERTRAEQALQTSNDRLLALRQVDEELSRQLDLPYVLKLRCRSHSTERGRCGCHCPGGRDRHVSGSGHCDRSVP